MNLDLVCQYALNLVGHPYVWGGNGPAFDCGGLVIEILKAAGLPPPHDMTAQQIFEHYRLTSGWDKKERGALAFFGKSTGGITHVAFMLSDSIVVEAGGGDHRVTSPEMAQLSAAFVRVRPLTYRKDFVAALLPSYP